MGGSKAKTEIESLSAELNSLGSESWELTNPYFSNNMINIKNYYFQYTKSNSIQIEIFLF